MWNIGKPLGSVVRRQREKTQGELRGGKGQYQIPLLVLGRSYSQMNGKPMCFAFSVTLAACILTGESKHLVRLISIFLSISDIYKLFDGEVKEKMSNPLE